MNKPKHTPGPWVRGTTITTTGYWDTIRNSTLSKEIVAIDVASIEQKANARLIAAAPELLEAGEAVSNCIKRQFPNFSPAVGRFSIDKNFIQELEKLREAIAKATGGEE